MTRLTHSGTLTVAGNTSGNATTATVNGSSATLYGDGSFAKAGFSVTNGINSFTAVATDALGRSDSHTVTVNLPSTLTYAYDSNGNLRSDGRRFFDYDDENQLTRVTVTNILKSEFTYDGKMRRRIKKDFHWSGSAWTQTNELRYLYDGMQVIQDRGADNLPTATYTRGIDLGGGLDSAGGIGGLLARTDLTSFGGTGSTHYFAADGNGNVTALFNHAQALTATYTYDPYGNLLSLAGKAAELNRFRFSSKDHDPQSGLSYYGYRFYDPNLQRWINRDPVEEAGGVNLFAFANNSPITLYDPLGLESDPKCLAKCGRQNLRDLAICAGIGVGGGIVTVGVCTWAPALCALAAQITVRATAACIAAAEVKYAACVAGCAITGKCPPYPFGPNPYVNPPSPPHLTRK